MRDKIEYQSGATVSQRAPHYILGSHNSINFKPDPRAKTNQNLNLYQSRVGTQVITIGDNSTNALIIGFGGSLTSGSNGGGGNGGDNGGQNPGNITPPWVKNPYYGNPPLPVTNLSAAWSTGAVGGLVLKFTYDLKNPININFAYIKVEIGADPNYTIITPIYPSTLLDGTKLDQTLIIPLADIKKLGLGGLSQFTNVGVATFDDFGQTAGYVTCSLAPYVSNIPAPILANPVASTASYSITTTNLATVEATYPNFQSEIIQEFISTLPSGTSQATIDAAAAAATPGWTIIGQPYVSSPVTIFAPDGNQRWVRAYYIDSSGATTSYSNYVVVTPTALIANNTTPPSGLVSASAAFSNSGAGDDVVVSYTLPTINNTDVNRPINLKVKLVPSGTSLSGYFYHTITPPPTVSTTATQSTAGSIIVVASNTGITTGMAVTGTNIPSNTTVSSISGTNITLSNSTTTALGTTPVNVSFTSNISSDTSFTIISAQLYAQFGSYYQSFSGTIDTVSASGTESSTVTNLSTFSRTNSLSSQKADMTVTSSLSTYTVAYNFGTTTANSAQLYQFYLNPTAFASTSSTANNIAIADYINVNYVSGSNGSTTLTVNNLLYEGGIFTPPTGHGFSDYIGAGISGTGLQPNTYITNITTSGSNYILTLNQAIDTVDYGTPTTSTVYIMQNRVDSSIGPATIFTSYYNTLYLLSTFYDKYGNRSANSLTKTVTVTNPAAIAPGPVAPTIQTPISTTYNSATLTITTTDNTTNEYLVYYKKHSDSSYTASLFNTSTTFTGTPATSTTTINIVNLIPNTQYDFYVLPISFINGSGTQTGISSATTATPTIPAPTNVTIKNAGYTLNTTWTQPTSFPTQLSQYQIELYSGSTLLQTQYTFSTTFSFTNLTIGTYSVKVYTLDIYGNISVAATPTPSTITISAYGTDGNVPSSSPTPILTPQFNSLFASWNAITNNDPVTYEVHISINNNFTPISTIQTGIISAAVYNSSNNTITYTTSGSNPSGFVTGQVVTISGSSNTNYNISGIITVSTNTFTINGITSNPGTFSGTAIYSLTTKALETNSTAALIRDLPNTNIALSYGTTYYVKILAKDPDGPAASTGSQASSQTSQVAGSDVASQTIVAGNIQSGTITSGQIDTNNLLVGSKIIIGGKTYYITNVASSTPTTGYVTYTTSVAHSFVSGDLITISGLNPTGYNGNYTVSTTYPPTLTTFIVPNSTTGSVSSYTTSTIVSYTPTNQIVIDTTGKGQAASPFKIYSGTGTYSNSSTPFYLDSTGQFSLKDRLYFDGNNTLTVQGTINALSGNFVGSMTVNGGTMKFGAAAGGTGKDGIYINTNSYWYNDGTFSIGNGSGNAGVTWDGTTLTTTGTINAQSGKFSGNVNIATGGQLYSGTLTGNNLNTGYMLNTTGLYFNQSGTPTTYIIASTGQLVTNSALIGGWNINSNGIETGSSGTFTGFSSNGTYAIYAGATNTNGISPQFGVTSAGAVIANQLTVKGNSTIDIGGNGVSTTGTATSGSTTLTVGSNSGLSIGQYVIGSGIASFTKISGISGTTITLDTKTTSTVSGTVYFVDSSGSHITSGGTLFANNAQLTGGINVNQQSYFNSNINLNSNAYLLALGVDLSNNTSTISTGASLQIAGVGLVAYDKNHAVTTTIFNNPIGITTGGSITQLNTTATQTAVGTSITVPANVVGLIKQGMTISGTGIPTSTTVSSVTTSTNTVVLSAATTQVLNATPVLLTQSGTVTNYISFQTTGAYLGDPTQTNPWTVVNNKIYSGQILLDSANQKISITANDSSTYQLVLSGGASNANVTPATAPQTALSIGSTGAPAFTVDYGGNLVAQKATITGSVIGGTATYTSPGKTGGTFGGTGYYFDNSGIFKIGSPTDFLQFVSPGFKMVSQGTIQLTNTQVVGGTTYATSTILMGSGAIQLATFSGNGSTLQADGTPTTATSSAASYFGLTGNSIIGKAGTITLDASSIFNVYAGNVNMITGTTNGVANTTPTAGYPYFTMSSGGTFQYGLTLTSAQQTAFSYTETGTNRSYAPPAQQYISFDNTGLMQIPSPKYFGNFTNYMPGGQFNTNSSFAYRMVIRDPTYADSSTTSLTGGTNTTSANMYVGPAIYYGAGTDPSNAGFVGDLWFTY